MAVSVGMVISTVSCTVSADAKLIDVRLGAAFNSGLDCADAELIVVRPGAAFNSGGLCTDPELIGVRSRAVFNCGLVLVDYIDAML